MTGYTRILAVLLAVLIGGGVGLLARLVLYPSEAPIVTVLREGAATGVSLIGGPFTLVDQNGMTRQDAEFRGRLMLVYFGFTYCPDACPTSLQVMSDALDLIGDDAPRVQPILITIDPARDTPQRLKDYAAHFHPLLLALTGTAEQVAEAARAYRVYYAKSAATAPGDPDYMMDHSTFIYLMGSNGKYLTHFRPDVPADRIAVALRDNL